MSPRTRTSLFLSLLVLFLLTGTVMVFYSRGWALDPKTLKVEKTGGIYIDIDPKGGSISVNGKLYPNESDLFGNSLLVRSLLPGKYAVSVWNKGYHPWQKVLDVKPSLVTRASDLFMFPERIVPQRFPGINNIKDFRFVRDKILYNDRRGLLHISDGEKAVELLGASVEAYDPNSNTFVTRSSAKRPVFYAYNAAQPASSTNISATFNRLMSASAPLVKNDTGGIVSIYLHPFDSGRLIVKTSKALYMLDLQRNELSLIEQGTISAMAVTDSVLYTYNTVDGLSRFNLILKSRDPIMPPIKDESVTHIYPASNFIVLHTAIGNIYGINAQKNIEFTAGGIVAIAVSQDSRKIAYADKDGVIYIRYLADYFGLFQKKEGESVKMVIDQKPYKLVWYRNNNYIISYTDSARVLIEIDEGASANTYSLSGLDDLAYDTRTNFFYHINEGSLYRYRIEQQ